MNLYRAGLVGTVASFAALVGLVGCWGQDWVTGSMVFAAALAVAGCLFAVRWCHEREALERLGARPTTESGTAAMDGNGWD